MIYLIVWNVARLLAIVFFRLRAFGRKNIPDDSGVVLASNHQSYLDPVLIGLPLARPVYFLARKELFEFNRFFGWFLRNLHAIPLERRTFDSTGLREAIEILQKGGLLVVFPEGTRTSDGKIGKIQKGIGLLGLKANVPLIPTLINGTYQSWPRQHKLPIRFKPVSIRFNKPVWLDKTNISDLVNYWEELKNSKSGIVK